MGGGDTKKTETTQSSETNPWAPTMPLLSSILGQLGGINTGVSNQQQTALNNLNSAAGSIPDLSGGLTSAVTGALGTSTAPQQGMLSDAYKTYTQNLGNTASGAELDPYSTPGFSDAIGTMTNDITNQVKGVFAGSGRDPSGAGSFSGSLGRGLTQGIAPVIASQFNQNKQNQMSAANGLLNGAGTTASGTTQQQLAQLQAQFQGLQGAGALPGLLTAPASTQLAAANANYSQPLSNIGQLSGLVSGIAGLGGTSSGKGTSETEQSRSLLSNIIGGASGLAGLNGAMGGGWLSSLGGGIGSALSSLGPLAMFSDERVKDNVTEVGETHDGQPLYSYTYKGSDIPQIGLLAQDVEKRDPAAVGEIGGIKVVDYGRALGKSQQLGMLKMAA